jgi:hypothetical protein
MNKLSLLKALGSLAFLQVFSAAANQFRFDVPVLKFEGWPCQKWVIDKTVRLVIQQMLKLNVC